MPSTVIAPSLLAADFSRLVSEIQRVNRSEAEWLHLDIMDGHFVPNISFGPDIVKVLRPKTRAFFDVHLMCQNPEILLKPFSSAGADLITVHIELGENVGPLLWKIRSMGKQVGLAVNPPTPMDRIKPYLDRIDLLLVMTVNPGFGGQPFIEECLPKVQQACLWRERLGLDYRIEVDGGINLKTAGACAASGADTFVAGTALFKQPNLRAAVARLRSLCEGKR